MDTLSTCKLDTEMSEASLPDESQSQPPNYLKKYQWSGYLCPECDFKSQDWKIFEEHIDGHGITPDISQVLEEAKKGANTTGSQIKRIENVAKMLKNKKSSSSPK